MDISAIEGEELKAVEFVEDFLQLRFGDPLLTLYAWPHVLLPDFSVAFGEPEYRNALCAQIGEQVEKAALEEADALTIEFANGSWECQGAAEGGDVVEDYAAVGGRDRWWRE